MYAYKINDNGYIIDNYLISGEIDIPKDCILVQLPQPLLFHKTKWNGKEWIEGESEEEKEARESQSLLDSLKPSLTEIENAELEIKLITLLTELGVI